jgi:2-polyprenyl-3-methyl-5-hydroxy-6-metoxy-1,4-benzoquinol methylase
MSQAIGISRPATDTVNAKVDGAAEASGLCLLCASPLELMLDGVTDNRLGAPGEYEIRKCVRCGLEQTVPVPNQHVLKELYEKYYNFGGEQNTLYAKLREMFLFSFAYRFWVSIDGDVAFHAFCGPGRLLDVGCNEGRSLRIFARHGFQADGLELNRKAAENARQAGFDVQTCLLEEFDPASRYDVAVLSNVLEHSLEPRRMLQEIHRILAAEGQVWISCPNSHSWLRQAFGRSWINWHVPFHISHFSAETLGPLLQETGFVDIHIRQITPALWVTQSLIAKFFAKRGQKTKQLRSPFLTMIVMMLARFVAFPILWLGNRTGRGDCLQVIATRG